jgi:uncharacterized protein YjlB
MPITDQVRNYARKLVEKSPAADEARTMVRARTPSAYRFSDDGIVPNHPKWPLLLYRRAIRFSKDYDPATIIDTVFEANGWGRSWRDSIYDFVHYHSQVHEVLGVARGTGEVEFGGVKGRRLRLRAGDIAVLPAGTGHRLIEASKDFLVVGAYPPAGAYDECTDTRERPEAIKRIARATKPKRDPVLGAEGGLTKLWKMRRMPPPRQPRRG